jgi:hypothetical protein
MHNNRETNTIISKSKWSQPIYYKSLFPYFFGSHESKTGTRDLIAGPFTHREEMGRKIKHSL